MDGGSFHLFPLCHARRARNGCLSWTQKIFPLLTASSWPRETRSRVKTGIRKLRLLQHGDVPSFFFAGKRQDGGAGDFAGKRRDMVGKGMLHSRQGTTRAWLGADL